MRGPRRAAWLITAVVVAVGCGSSHPPPRDPFSSEPDPGVSVLVEKNGQWAPATVVRSEGPGRVRVHYEGWGPQWDETVSTKQLKLVPATPPESDYRAGEMVLVSVQGRIALAQVQQQLSHSVWRVHYDGFGPEAVEEVGVARLRRQFAGTSSHGVGETVMVDGATPGHVIAILAADRWLVRMEGRGPDGDQEIGESRIAPR